MRYRCLCMCACDVTNTLLCVNATPHVFVDSGGKHTALSEQVAKNL